MNTSIIPMSVFSRLPPLLRCALPGAGWLACGLLSALVTQAPLGAQAREFGIEVHGISNGASFAIATLKQGIAPGSIFVISGQQLGPQELVVAPAPYPAQLPAEAGGTRVAFHNSETAAVYDAPLIHTSFRQVAGIVPPAMPAGIYTVAVSYQQESAAFGPFLVTAAAPGLFATSMVGFGPGVVQNFESSESIPLNRLTQPALPGGHLIIWGTGLGSADGSSGADLSAGMVRQDVWAEIGGIRMRPSYAGPAPGFPGLDQINVALPTEDLASGCYVRLRVIANSVASNSVTVSLSETPGTCAHPMGFSTETLKRLDEGGTVVLGRVDLQRTANSVSQLIPGFSKEGAAFVAAQFYRANAQLVFLNRGAPIAPHGCNVPSAVRAGAIFSSQWIDAPAFQTPIPAIDAGPSLTATGPSGQTLELVRQEYDSGPTGSYSFPGATAGDVLQAGVWKITGTGGADIGAFEATIAMLPRRTVDFPEVVRLDEPLEITWPVTGLDDRHTAHIGLSVALPAVQGEFSVTHGFFLGFSCALPAADGRLTVPADILQGRLPPETEGTHSIHLGIDARPIVFAAPGMDYGTAQAGVSESRPVTVE